ncbi:MAG: DUF4097 domain-containing protein [Verrucomicrobia bacterium]|nr:DUF4097 domain-containing protein [Verrucomicrobiota bacterium]
MTLRELRLPLFVLAGVVLAAPPLARAGETEKVTRTFPLAADGTVSLENVNGSVEIVAWDKPEVLVEAEIRGRTAEDVKCIRVEFEAEANRLAIKTKYERKDGLFWGTSPRGDVRYVLRVPAGASLKKISTVNSGIKVEGVRGEVQLSTVNGGIRANGLAGHGRFKTVNGSIHADYEATASVNRIDLDTVNGACTLRLPNGSNARLRADTVNGAVRCDLPVTVEKSTRRSLRGDIGTGGTLISLESVNGSLRIEKKAAGPEAG